MPITWPHAKMTLASPVGENTPAGQLGLAREFFAAARASMEFETIRMRPIYREISHAIELALKAFLLSMGMTEGELRGPAVRHNLRELLDRALANDLALPNDVIAPLAPLDPPTGEPTEWQNIAELSRAAVAEALRGQRVSGRGPGLGQR